MSKEGLQPWYAIGKLAGGVARIRERVETEVGSWDLLLHEGRRRRVISRKLVELGVRKIEIEELPAVLKNPEGRAIVVSNYRSIPLTFEGLMKLACSLPGERIRVRGIGREEFITKTNLWQRALGIDGLTYPAKKDEAGAYRLDEGVLGEVMGYLDGSGNVLWMSPTGSTRGNGLLEEEIRTGAALFSVRKGIPLVPMGIVTSGEGKKTKVVGLRFGEVISSSEVSRGEFEFADLLLDLTRLAMCEIARVLPPGQRGDFENVEEKLIGVRARLGFSS